MRRSAGSSSNPLEKLTENHGAAGHNYRIMGILYYYLGDYDLALEYWQKCLRIRLRLFGEEDIKVAKSYNDLGNGYADKGDNDKALEFYKRSVLHKKKDKGAGEKKIQTLTGKGS